jgi:hypothetical protein
MFVGQAAQENELQQNEDMKQPKSHKPANMWPGAKGVVQLSSVDSSTTDLETSITDREVQMQPLYPI